MNRSKKNGREKKGEEEERYGAKKEDGTGSEEHEKEIGMECEWTRLLCI